MEILIHSSEVKTSHQKRARHAEPVLKFKSNKALRQTKFPEKFFLLSSYARTRCSPNTVHIYVSSMIVVSVCFG